MTPQATRPEKRPAAITILTWILFLSAVVNILIGIFELWDLSDLHNGLNSIEIIAPLDTDEVFTPDGAIYMRAVWLVVVGVVQLGITFGFWRVQRWAWVMAMTWQALKLLTGVATAFLGSVEFFPLFFAILIVLLLNQTDVRRAFGILPKPDESAGTTPLRIFESN